MDRVKIRPAVAADAAALLEIYAPYVRETTITFEYETPGKETFAGRIEAIAAEYPYLVCEIDGRIAAYAYGHRHMERAAYQWNVKRRSFFETQFWLCALSCGGASAGLSTRR